MLVEEFMRFCERWMMSLEWMGINGRGRAGYIEDLRRKYKPEKEQVEGDRKKHRVTISIICAYHQKL
jgi:hypothetical protein